MQRGRKITNDASDKQRKRGNRSEQVEALANITPPDDNDEDDERQDDEQKDKGVNNQPNSLARLLIPATNTDTDTFKISIPCLHILLKPQGHLNRVNNIQIGIGPIRAHIKHII